MGGSVFVMHGTLDTLACDAWLLPWDGQSASEYWWNHVPDAVGRRPGGHLPESVLGPQRGLTRKVVGWSIEGRDGTHSQAWATDVLAHSVSDRPWEPPLRDFVAAARPDRSALGRARPLLGVPMIGTGRSDTPMKHGAICRGLLPTLQDLAQEHDVDLVLVAKDGDHFSAAQAVRRQQNRNWWPAVTGSPELLEAAHALARRVISGDLVLFLGAGVARRAGVPGWRDLLSHLAASAGMDPAEVQSLQSSQLGNLERAAVVDAHLASQHASEEAAVATRNALLRQLVDVGRHSLLHGLTAGLPVREVATTNYDQLFELASEMTGRRPSVLPYDSVADGGRWLLKLHGSAEKGDLVLSRRDYLRTAQRGAALAGLVQALLITKHLCFIGYSLDDDSFHRIVFDVREALHQGAGDAGVGRFGTALMVNMDHHLARVWSKDISMVDVGTDAEGADHLEQLLDHVGCHATYATPHLFNSDLDDVLTGAELSLRSGVAELVRTTDLAGLDPAVAAPLRALMASYGLARPEDVSPTA